MDAWLSSRPESFTQLSSQSLAIMGSLSMPGEDSLTRTADSTSDTPLNGVRDSLGTGAEKGIVVDASPSLEMADAPAVTVNEITQDGETDETEDEIEPGIGAEDEDEEDEEGSDEDEDAVVARPYQKRKRASLNYSILDDSGFTNGHPAGPSETPPAKRRQGPKIRGVIIGAWRDSSEPNDEEKHVIFGFIDIHDRLRTRIYAMNRRGEELIGNAPTGAGGCWVTFERIIFEPHLKDLNPTQVKEYVKIRSAAKAHETAEEKLEADQKAALRAIQIAADEASTPNTKPVIQRRSIGRSSSQRDSVPRQSLHKSPSFQAINAVDIQSPKPSPLAESKNPGTLLGFWADSDQQNDVDKHAVYGVLSIGDCFRVKVQRLTRDGRYVDGNFPTGAGALWLHYDKVVLEPHLAPLRRPEVKEYCRFRQRDLAKGESEKERKANELRAVRYAKAAVAGEYHDKGTSLSAPSSRGSLEMETRHSARSELKIQARQQAEAEAGAAQKRQEKAEARERQNEKARKEVATAESIVQEAAQQELKNNIKKLNKVWVAQQAATTTLRNGSHAPSAINGIGAIDSEVKYYNGIKYERKQNGPFQGKLVSSAQIFSIDGEDYVEYRVLTKPSFF